jgi:hypothetical protein
MYWDTNALTAAPPNPATKEMRNHTMGQETWIPATAAPDSTGGSLPIQKASARL